jgi:hypothetical protein
MHDISGHFYNLPAAWLLLVESLTPLLLLLIQKLLKPLSLNTIAYENFEIVLILHPFLP